ncbi:hypothetical protein C8F04DRAFT_1172992 [Mycena alexandri]|uniref:Uncharacterized protein n=1 Tax=Mycena alexandri TaxID=1745969 RepID=A0AAD6THY2_9AGAR|nr:hypothetical protein C8F04DRAFT_1172992 [Mycena alexandri]
MVGFFSLLQLFAESEVFFAPNSGHPPFGILLPELNPRPIRLKVGAFGPHSEWLSNVKLAQFFLESNLGQFCSFKPTHAVGRIRSPAMSTRASTRSSARKIATSISQIAAHDLVGTDDETMDVDATIVVDDEEIEKGASEDEQEDEKSSEDDDGDDEEEEFDGEGQGGSDGGSQSSDEEEVVVLPKKRKHKNKNKIAEESEDEEEVVVVAKKKQKKTSSKTKTGKESPREIEYKVLLFTHTQMKLKRSSRGPPVTEIVTLKSNESWPALRTYILANLNSTLHPTQLLFSNYIVTFTVPRQVSDPIHLNDKDKYEYLVKKALLIVKNPSAKIMVEPKIEDKENEMNIADADSTPKPKSSGKKTKVPKARDILPANVELNEKIGELRERWVCPSAGGPCGSSHCFFTPASPNYKV